MATKKTGARPGHTRVKKPAPAARSKSPARKPAARRAAATELVAREVLVREAPNAAFPAQLRSGTHVFSLEATRLRLTLKKRVGDKALHQLLEELRVVLDDGREREEEKKPNVLASERSLWVRSPDRGAFDARRIRTIRSHPQVTAVSPVYRRTDLPGVRGLMSPRLGALIVRADLAERYGKDLAASGLKLDARFRVQGLRYLTSGDLNDMRVFDVGAKLASRAAAPARGAVLRAATGSPAPAVSYDWTPLVSPFAVVPVDPADTLFDTGGGDDEQANHQWYLKRVGARYAWGAFPPGQPGDGAVTVVMFDRGADLQHADLTGIQQIDISLPAPDPANKQPFDAHGTQLAGIVRAQHNDGNRLAGLAPGCPFVSLRYDDGAGDQFSVSTAAVATAITYAGGIANSVLLMGMDAGASVLTDGSVQAAIDANTRSLIVVATGNDDGTAPNIDYGAVQPHVLVCGGYAQTDAANRNGRWLAEAAPDVGSKVGPEVSVAAPAEDILTTTWVSGMSDQYTAGPGLRGTSLAAAQAAGMAALVWSKNLAATREQIRTQLEQTAAKCGVDRPSDPGVEQTAYRTVAGHPNGIWNDHLGYGSIDASAVLVTLASETDSAPSDPERARVIIRDNPGDLGVPEPSGGSLVTECDIIVSTNPNLVTTGVITAGGAEDLDFSANAIAAVNSVGSASAYYVFVRVVNIGPAPARGIRVTASLAACATSFMYPSSWDDPTIPGGITINALNDAPPADLSYLQGPLPVNGVFVARLTVPAGSDFSGFGGHACCVARAVAANDVNFTRASVSGAMAQRTYNNLAQRNLSIV